MQSIHANKKEPGTTKRTRGWGWERPVEGDEEPAEEDKIEPGPTVPPGNGKKQARTGLVGDGIATLEPGGQTSSRRFWTVWDPLGPMSKQEHEEVVTLMARDRERQQRTDEEAAGVLGLTKDEIWEARILANLYERPDGEADKAEGPE
ncbi:unnamed protein product [Zymoseptoria tritici ST99CH_1A5]|uniref:Uncharacterized protein n=3 Tax=Zymoseptoria tritici TaxID=1047171 RepID=F9WXF0_ZYMTI|nr:uncharacterized protein MYCGRDRAFT_88620 [Zymoseptoria tritici IPO323]EGP92767.1 hypothetical protein MYCGRDRAFT_88620 [Zymoseptoria tritici IPO323]SMR41259.1 unnamed protein product [Zymoseptoria tritici ST99CH_1E4]SMY18605.1 unnamed protein product [Zymoseptoria tritici ST99CH_1A5]